MDLNVASYQDLLNLYGVGDVRARAILQTRHLGGRPLTLRDVSECTNLPMVHVQRWVASGLVRPLYDESSDMLLTLGTPSDLRSQYPRDFGTGDMRAPLHVINTGIPPPGYNQSLRGGNQVPIDSQDGRRDWRASTPINPSSYPLTPSISILNPVRDDRLIDSRSARPSMTPHGVDPHPDVIFQDHMTSNLPEDRIYRSRDQIRMSPRPNEDVSGRTRRPRVDFEGVDSHSSNDKPLRGHLEEGSNQTVVGGHRSRNRYRNRQENRDSSSSGRESGRESRGRGLDSSGSDSGSEARRHRHRRSPSLFKSRLDMFHGDVSKWRSFIILFKQVAQQKGWSRASRLTNLLHCMRDKAICYVDRQPRRVREDYYSLLEILEKRYGRKEPAASYRRDLYSLKQLEGEEIDDFADRVYEIAAEGFPDADEKLIESIAAETFLKGCKDRQASYMASEKKNDTLATALRHVRHSQQNMKTLGSRHNVRQVVFDESAKGKTETKSGGNAEKHVSYADLVQLIKKLDQRLTLYESGSAKSASPNRGQCFQCGQVGHFKRDCPRGPRSRSPSPGYKCFQCNSPSHMKNNCPQLKDSPSNRRGQSPVNTDLNK